MIKINSDNIVFKLHDPFSEFDLVKKVWTSMLNISPHTYFHSWAWTEIWIKNLPRDCGLQVVVAYYQKTPVLAFFVGSKSLLRHKFFKINQLSVNLTLIPKYDIVYIEYNVILINPEFKISFQSILDLLPIKSWDELLITRHSSVYQPQLLIKSGSGSKYEILKNDILCYYVDLEKVRKNKDLLHLLSKNKRKQIRRTIKEYQKIGEIRAYEAQNAEEALDIFDEMGLLHQQQWTKRRHPGVFSNKYFVEFHKSLIKARFQHKEIQLFKVMAGDNTVGCLYNFKFDDMVLCYQSGYSYTNSNLYRPGLICDFYAISHNSRLGMSTYDFLSGASEYKKSLSTDFNVMQNIVAHKKSFKYELEKYSVRLYRAYNKFKSRH